LKKEKTRLFSTSQPTVTCVYWTPINVLVWNVFEIDFGTSFSLEMLSVILSANVAAEQYSLRNNSLTRDSAQLILSYTLGLPQSRLDVDKNHTVSQRIEPNSCTTLQDEQSYPSNRLQLEDVISRHRGVKPIRRCGLLGLINLLSPAYL
jgi:hypothetical protein